VANLRSGPIDRRRLSRKDRTDFNKAGGNNTRLQAVKRAKAYRGQKSFEANVPRRTTVHKPGTGGFTQGATIQQQRLREQGQETRRTESLRPAMDSSTYDIYD